MPGTPTTKYAIPTLAGTDLARDIDTNVNAAVTAIDSKMVGYSEGPLSSRPTSTGGSPGVKGRIYYATDIPRYFIDMGTGWVEFQTATAPASGKSIITAAESRTNVAYGTLTTPDQVAGIVVPTEGRLLIAYQALVKESVNGAAAIAIFIGADQLKGFGPQSGTSPAGASTYSTPAAGIAISDSSAVAQANRYGWLATTTRMPPVGVSPQLGMLTNILNGDVAAPASTEPVVLAQELTVFLPAGTYTISVQFKSTSGSVTAKERRLWVRTLA